MSSTNKTTNYELSQYVGSDKPTYLGDYNSDMLKIDTQMKTNADNITAVNATATTANTTANTALTNASTAQTTADNANTSASNASSVATQALSKATAVESTINGHSILMCKPATNQTVTSSSNFSAYTVNLSESVIKGSKFSTSNNTITIGSGVDNIKISATLNIEDSTSNDILGLIIMKNTEWVYDSYYVKAGTLYGSHTVSDFVVPVEENDVITLKLYVHSSSRTVTIKTTSYITIEEIL